MVERQKDGGAETTKQTASLLFTSRPRKHYPHYKSHRTFVIVKEGYLILKTQSTLIITFANYLRKSSRGRVEVGMP